jgi:hypothetical protein
VSFFDEIFGTTVGFSHVGQLSQRKKMSKENESQRTEIPGYINQLSIQLHRWQLRLQTLNERKKELAAEIDGIQKVAQELGQSYRTFSAN